MTTRTPVGFQQRLGDRLTALAAERTVAPFPVRRRTWVARHRLPLALAGVAAAGATLVTVAVDRPATPTRATREQQPQRITTVAYTLQREAGGRVRLAISGPDGRLLDTARLQRDLNRLGVPAVVYAGDPACTAAPTSSGDDAPSSTWRIELAKGGKPVLSVRPDRIAAGQHLLVAFPLLRTDPDRAAYVITAGRTDGTPPACVPAWPRGSSR
ncbi:hypothetical protein [Streptomyces gilvus]|uniref:hypothetical protein n=1 Tax=Streptomyces gilvus TaxID=2920937 RepID=UPI001F0DDDEA|nr:hypothetical protein [Streptomyces sp. CME 23]MCH5672004.1 hypothetical protein [Streptomyces sp. CME 23]